MLKLESIIEKRHRQWADVLQEKSAKCSRNCLAVLFVLYLSIYAAACLYIAGSALQHPASTLVIQPINLNVASHYKRLDTSGGLQKTTSPVIK